MFPEAGRQRLIILAPSEQEAPDSSLSYMLSRFVDWFGTENSMYAWRDGELRMGLLVDTLRAAGRSPQLPRVPFYGGYLIHLDREGWVW